MLPALLCVGRNWIQDLSLPDAKAYFHDYEQAIAAIAQLSKSDKAADNPGISVKLSALHPRYEYGKKTRVIDELGARTQALHTELV